MDRTAIRDTIRKTDMMTVAGPVKFDEKGIPVDKVLVNIQFFGGKVKMVHTNAAGKKFPNEIPLSPFQYKP